MWGRRVGLVTEVAGGERGGALWDGEGELKREGWGCRIVRLVVGWGRWGGQSGGDVGVFPFAGWCFARCLGWGVFVECQEVYSVKVDPSVAGRG